MNSIKQNILLKFVFLAMIICLWNSPSVAQFYQGTQMTFGKNKVQYNEFFWSYYRFKNFDSYFYKGGNEIAMYVGRVADDDLAGIQKLYDYNLDGRLQFIVFNRLSDMKQSNIGLSTDDVNNTGGVTHIVGSKILLYFDGDHRHLREQIRDGIANVLFNQIMYGGDAKDVLQNAAMLNIPDWYSKGLFSYIANNWDTDLDNRMRDGIISGRFRKFNRLEGKDAVVAGHSLWRYIADVYGESAISNLIYMTKINRNIEGGMNFVLGSSLRTLTDSWYEYYSKKYFNSDKGKELPLTKPLALRAKQLRTYSQMKISPDGNYVAFVRNDMGKYKVYLYNLQKNSKKKLFKDGYKSLAQINDETMPVLCWHPTGKLLTMIREYKGQVKLTMYNMETKKLDETNLLGFDKVTDYGYSDDGQNLVFAGVMKGQSDIFVYNLRSRTYQQITNDLYDDFNPRFVNHSTQIVFASDRVNDTLKVDKWIPAIPVNANTDLFLYDYKTKSKVLKRLTNSPFANESQPYQYDSANIAYLNDENGITNQYIAHLDSVISYVDTVEHYRDVVTSFPITNSPRNILSQDINSRTRKETEIIYMDGKYRLYNEPMTNWDGKPKTLQNTPFERTLINKNDTSLSKESQPPIPSVKVTPDNKQPRDSNYIDINNYIFNNDVIKPLFDKKKEEPKKIFDIAPKATPKPLDTLSKKSQTELLSIFKARNYDLSFTPNYIVTQVDNSTLTPIYQTFNPGSPVYFDPGLLGVIKFGISDLMEDYRIVGGVRLSGDLANNEYLLSYENLKSRLDKKLSFYRLGQTSDDGDGYTTRTHSNEVEYSLRWPFSDLASIQGSMAYRNNRNALQASDETSLTVPTTIEHWGILNAAYVYDNTINTGLNLYNGTRFKIFAQMYHQDTAIASILSQPGIPSSTMYVVGLDFRHYIKVSREIIWANRFAWSSSFGQQKLIYYLGGVDNNLFPKFNQNTNIDLSQNYAYQALATNMRGFDQNVRNGNSFAVINSELRIPIIQYLSNHPLKSDFFRNFQIIGFCDIGTAWTGTNPFDSLANINKTTINSGPSLTVILESERQPIVVGYGLGVRIKLLGYFFRLDYAWGYEDYVSTPPIFTLSFGLDF